jgi:hypothetical protein
VRREGTVRGADSQTQRLDSHKSLLLQQSSQPNDFIFVLANVHLICPWEVLDLSNLIQAAQ